MTTPMLASLTTWLLLATSHARPHHQEVYYHGVPAQQAASFVYVPQADAANVASIQQYAANPGVATLDHQYVLLYPGVQQGNLLPRADEKPAEAAPPTIWNLFNLFGAGTTTTTTTARPDEATTQAAAAPTVPTRGEETTPKPVEEAPAKPEKLVGDTDEAMVTGDGFGAPTNEQRASLENLDESVPHVVDPSPGTRHYMPVQRPQFFGNYNLLKQGDMQQNFGIPPGAVSNFLLFRHGISQPEVVPAASSQSGRPLKLQEDEGVYSPGVAAIRFQQELESARLQQGESQSEIASDSQQAGYAPVQTQFYLPSPAGTQFVTSEIGGQGLVSFRHTIVPNPVATYPVIQPGVVNVGPGYQSVYLVSPRQAVGMHEVAVEADGPKKGDKEDAEDVEAEQAGPSVAQAKPQAIALAGPGGVAAAAPVATAVVGTGGLAVSAPSATAVAGPSGGGTLVGPAQAAVVSVNKHISGVKDSRHDGTVQSEHYYEQR